MIFNYFKSLYGLIYRNHIQNKSSYDQENRAISYSTPEYHSSKYFIFLSFYSSNSIKSNNIKIKYVWHHLSISHFSFPTGIVFPFSNILVIFQFILMTYSLSLDFSEIFFYIDSTNRAPFMILKTQLCTLSVKNVTTWYSLYNLAYNINISLPSSNA